LLFNKVEKKFDALDLLGPSLNVTGFTSV